MDHKPFKLSDLLGRTPAPIQTSLLAENAHEVGMITGFAAGKTRALCAKALHHAAMYPQAKVLFGRKTFSEMVNTDKQPFFSMAEPLFRAGWFVKPQRWDYREGTHVVRMSQGSQIFFSNLDDPIKFRNEEYSLVLVDQGEEIREDLWETLLARIRWDKVPPHAWQAVVAANDEGHNWIWKRFVKQIIAHQENPNRCDKDPRCMFLRGHLDDDGDPQDIPCTTRRFFHGTTLDNSHNLSRRYLSSLLSRPERWQARFIYATMEGGGGRLLPDPTVIPHFDPPAHWPRYRAIDDALNGPACCIWVAVNSDRSPLNGINPNVPYVYREYYRDNASVDMHADMINRLSRDETIVATVIDRHAFNRTQSREGGVRLSIADLYANEGIYTIPSVGEPFPRIERIEMFHNRGMKISDTCTHIIADMPEYYAEQQAATGLFKIIKKSTFHSVDALGYALMAIPIDSRDMEDTGAQPDYLKRTDIDNLTRRHHTAEHQRMTAFVEKHKFMQEAPIYDVTPVAEFWGDSEFATEFRPGA